MSTRIFTVVKSERAETHKMIYSVVLEPQFNLSERKSKMKEASFNAQRFAKLMKDKKFTDGKLAYASGISRSMIFYMRKGERNKVSGEIIATLADKLGTSPQYLMDQTDDPSPLQKTMSGLAADIVTIMDDLPPSRQRELRGFAQALRETESSATVDSIYNELMERITKLAEIEGGEAALGRLIDHLDSASGRSSGTSVSRGGRRRSSKDRNESTGEPTQSDN